MTALLPRVQPRSTEAPAPSARFLRSFQILTFGYPLLWVVGVGGLYWVLVGLAGALYLARRRMVDRLALPLLVLVIALLASLPIGVLSFGLDVSRVASFFGNVLVWVAVIALVGVARELPGEMVRTVSRGLIVIGVLQALATFAGQVLYPSVPPVPLLGPVADRLPSGLGAFANQGGLYVLDWLNGAAFRSTGLMAQPTWAGAVGALAIIVGVRALVTERRAWRLAGAAAVLGGLYSLDLSLSRSTEISLVVASLVGIVVALRRFSAVLFAVLAAVLVLVATAVLLTSGRQIGTLLEDVNNARAGSLDSRSAIYTQTFDLVQRLPLPVLGYGIKPKEQGLVASVATHSSYLGLLFRSGALGLLAMLIFFAIVLALAVHTANGWAATLAVLTIMWCTLEDFDPGHLVPLGIVLAVALIGGRRRVARAVGSAPSA